MEFKPVRASGSKGLGDLLKAQNATIVDLTGRDAVADPLTDLVRKDDLSPEG